MVCPAGIVRLSSHSRTGLVRIGQPRRRLEFFLRCPLIVRLTHDVVIEELPLVPGLLAGI
jgi:hypothetical protein